MVKVFRSIGCRLKIWHYTKITRRKRTGCPGEGQVRAVYIMLFWKNWKFKLSACRLGHFTLLFSQPYSWGWRERRRGMSFKDKNITCTNTHTWLTSAIFFKGIFSSLEIYSKLRKFFKKELFPRKRAFLSPVNGVDWALWVCVSVNKHWAYIYLVTNLLNQTTL